MSLIFYRSLDTRPVDFPWTPGNRVLALGRFFDESGTHNDPFMVVAGYVAETDAWVRFSERWSEVFGTVE